MMNLHSKRARTGILILASILMMTAFASAQQAAKPRVVTLAVTNAWDSMMPLNTNSNYGALVYDQIYDRLVITKANGSFAPRLAKSWTANANSTAIVFTLNDKAKWHDGKPVTAQDVVFSCQLYSDPAVKALGRYRLNFFSGTDDSGAETSADSIGVKADNDYQVTFTLKKAVFINSVLDQFATSFYVIPKHVFAGKTVAEINAPTLWAKPVGSGPFKYDKEITGERMELTANKAYFLGAPDFDRLVIRIMPSTSLLSGLMSGEVDIVAGGAMGSVMLDDWDIAKKQTNLVTESLPTLNYQTLIINTQQPYMTQRVRQAFNMSINRKVLVDALLKGQGTAIMTPISPASPYYNESVKDIWYDPVKAAQILKEEKFPFDKELVFLVPSGNVTRERTAVLIEQDFEKLGVKVRIQTVDFPTLMNNMRQGQHDFGIIGSGGTIDPGESREMVSPTSSVNFSRLKTDELSKIIDEGTAKLTFETRKPIFDDYQEKVREVSSMPYLYTTNTLMAYNKRLSNIKAADFSRLNWTVWEWKVKD
jgi:peptide/nickel transport system substrate-binding protein